MDVPTFLLGLLKEQTTLLSAFAWPLAVVCVACLFRKEVRVLIGRVASIRSPFANVELKEELAQTQAAVANAVVKSDAGPEEASAEAPVGSDVDGTEGLKRQGEDVTKDLYARHKSQYLNWLATYRKLGDGRNAHNEVGMLIAQNWVPIERLISDMFSFATGTKFVTGLTTSDKAIRLAERGVINNAEAEAVIELDALTGRMLLSKASLDELSALDRYASMAESIRTLLTQRWARLRNNHAQSGGAVPSAE